VLIRLEGLGARSPWKTDAWLALFRDHRFLSSNSGASQWAKWGTQLQALLPLRVPAPPASEPARKNWFARHKILTTPLGLVSVVIVFAALNGGGGSTAPDTRSPVAASEAMPDPVGACA
jgi:hypothetical protein